jgi:hypothetical protein
VDASGLLVDAFGMAAAIPRARSDRRIAAEL